VEVARKEGKKWSGAYHQKSPPMVAKVIEGDIMKELKKSSAK